ncbi:hypothetical protein PN836_014620 [Ningiella sp. W23]|uniref:hypothetical protein n=1 Tax=Ningiella sp. W23 TaxID=3023715 RepID=UPI003757F066
MKLKDLIVFEPINLSNLVAVFIPIVFLLLFYGQEVGKFMDNLSSVKLNLLSGEITLASHPVVVPLEQMNSNFDALFSGSSSMDEMAKSTQAELVRRMESVDGRSGVLRYIVDEPFNHYDDDKMLEYLSVASSKVKFLAFYSNEQFVGAIEIEYVIAGLAGNQREYSDFRGKLASGNWREFPSLITTDEVFNEKPTLSLLHQRLKATGHAALPLVEQNKLVGFLDYKSIADDLYNQAASSNSA